MTLQSAKPTRIVLMLGAEQFESHAQAFFAEGTGKHLQAAALLACSTWGLTGAS